MKIDLKDAQAMLSQMTDDANDLLDEAKKQIQRVISLPQPQRSL